MELDYAIKPSFGQKCRSLLRNWRLMAFVGFFLALFGAVGYILVDASVSHGVHSHGSYTEVDLKSLGFFSFSNTDGRLTDIPKEYRELDGKRVKLTGVMFDGMSAASEVREFQLVYNIQKCCFSGPPQVQERVFVHAAKGRGAQWHDETVDVVGTLHVRLKRDSQGTIQSVYDMDLESMQPNKMG
jgi:hypothetical protein